MPGPIPSSQLPFSLDCDYISSSRSSFAIMQPYDSCCDSHDVITKSEPLEFAPALPLNHFEKLTEGIEQQPFSTLRSLQKSLYDRRAALEKDKTREQFLVFSDIPAYEVSKLSDDSCRVSKFARLTYNIATQTLIVKIMPGREHEAASREFCFFIHDEIIAMHLQNEIDSLGSATVQIGNWKKEADECWALSTKNTPITTILEIGLSESCRRLALDARGWLETSGTSVQVAFILNICRSIPQIIIKHYELSSRQYSIKTRASPISASCLKTISITRRNNTTEVSGDLRIPFKKFTGRDINPNNQLERDLFITDQKLRGLAEKVWRLQGFV